MRSFVSLDLSEMEPGEWSLPLEEEAMKRELEWLLGQEFTSFAALLQNQLRECIRFITRSRGQAGTANPNDPLGRSTPTLTPAPVSDFDPMEEQDDPYWIGVETTGRSVEARFAVEGWFIKEGKIGVKTPKHNKGGVFVTKIDQSWKFTQIHNAHNFIVLALDQIHDVVSVQSITATQILRSLDRIQDYLKLANDEFVLNRATTPKSPQALQVFRPALPETLNIQFEVVNTSWVMTVYVLQPPALSAKSSKALAEPITSDDQQNRVSGMDIIEVLQCVKPSKKLETIANHLHNLTQICSEFREKLVVLSSVENDDQTEAVQSLM